MTHSLAGWFFLYQNPHISLTLFCNYELNKHTYFFWCWEILKLGKWEWNSYLGCDLSIAKLVYTWLCFPGLTLNRGDNPFTLNMIYLKSVECILILSFCSFEFSVYWDSGGLLMVILCLGFIVIRDPKTSFS